MYDDDEFGEVVSSARLSTTFVWTIAGYLFVSYGVCLFETCTSAPNPMGGFLFVLCLVVSTITTLPFVPRALRAFSRSRLFLLKFGLAGAVVGALVNFGIFLVIVGALSNSFKHHDGDGSLLLFIAGAGAFAGLFGGLTTGLHAISLRKSGIADPHR